MTLEEIKDSLNGLEELKELEAIDINDYVEDDPETQEDDQYNYFVASMAINLLDDASFYCIDKDFKSHAVCVIKDKVITLYFPNNKVTVCPDTDFLIDFLTKKSLRLKRIKKFWKKFNPNPFKRDTGDCTLRAYCAAFNISWNCAYDIASKRAKDEGFILSDKKIVEKILTEVFKCQLSSFYNKKMVKAKNRVTVKQWAMANPYGTYICHINGHIVTIKNGKYYDSWDSGERKISEVYLVPDEKQKEK